MAFNAAPDKHDRKWRSLVIAPRSSRRSTLTSNWSQNDLNSRMSPSNFGSGTDCSFPSCNCGPDFSVKAGFATGSLLFSFSFKKVSARVRVVNTSLRNSRHSSRAASRDSPSGSTSSNAT
ncbi:hypothetical protein T11_1100 [Trichinella zimbabwensis]|uniref:Uncharacterized protein n=1 Tax=Trichinella zimbabwensis TaxID=268475 RepID=A0A0V1HF84_9BILA|nr:hypothetical protein T11_1100 [Trichinella zimbabwensis]